MTEALKVPEKFVSSPQLGKHNLKKKILDTGEGGRGRQAGGGRRRTGGRKDGCF